MTTEESVRQWCRKNRTEVIETQLGDVRSLRTNPHSLTDPTLLNLWEKCCNEELMLRSGIIEAFNLDLKEAADER